MNSSKKSKIVQVQFEPIPPEVTEWAIGKDRRYKQPEHRVSYSQALLMFVKDFEALKFGRTTPKNLTYWQKVWQWDWRKVVRFVAHVVEHMKSMWAKFDLRKFLQHAKRIRDLGKYYVQKARGKNPVHPSEMEPEPTLQELENLWLESLKSNAKGPGYITHIKKQLQNKDPQTVENFQNWLIDYQRKAKEAKAYQIAQGFDFEKIRGALLEKADSKIIKILEENDKYVQVQCENNHVENLNKIDIIMKLGLVA